MTPAKTKKRYVKILIALSISALAIQSAHAADSLWKPVISSDPGFHSVLFHETGALRQNHAVLQMGNQDGMWLCSSTSDPVCAKAQEWKFNAVLKACESVGQQDCIESVASVQNGTLSSGTFLKYTVSGHVNAFPEDKRLRIPAGDAPSIWSIPTAPHVGGDLYAIVAGIVGQVDKTGHGTERVESASLVPVVEVKSQNPRDPNWINLYYDSCRNIQQTPTRNNINCSSQQPGSGCSLPTNDPYICYSEVDFPANSEFNVKLRLSIEPNGWMHGRLVDPIIDISKASTGETIVSITGKSTSVPTVFQAGQWNELSAEAKAFWVDCMNNGDQCGLVGSMGTDFNYWEKALTLDGNRTVNLAGEMLDYGRIALEGMKAIAPLIQDRAVESLQKWNFRTLSMAEMASANGCFYSGSGVKGIVTTNSTTYSEGPPALADGSLNYKVASAHYLPDGSVFKGTYNLVMRSDVARCLYKFSSAPIKASIEVVSENGDTSNVATTVANEKDGWLYLSANNFTFSAPTVKVKLSQEGTSSPKATSKAPVKEMTITCIKGKTIKKVAGVKPVCPKGYVKK